MGDCRHYPQAHVRIAERPDVHGSRRRNLRQSLDARHEVDDELRAARLLRRVRRHRRRTGGGRESVRLRETDLDGQTPFRLEPSLSVENLAEAAGEQTRADEQRQRQSDLNRDQSVAEPVRATLAGRAALTLPQRGREIPWRSHGWRQAREQAGQQGDAHRERQHPPVDRDLSQPGDVGRADHAKPLHENHRQPEAADRAGGAEQH